MSVRTLWTIFSQACISSIEDRVPRLGAALAFYLTFSLAPLLLIVVVVASVGFGRHAVEVRLMTEIRPIVGEDAEETLRTLISAADQQQSGVIASIVASVTVLIGAVGFFCELQDALNVVLPVSAKPSGGVWPLIRSRVLSFLLVVVCGLLLLASVALSTAVSAVAGLLDGNQKPILEFSALIHLLAAFVPLIIITVLFALIYRFLPDARTRWQDVWFGAIASSLLFAIGKSLLGIYLAQIAIASLYGAAASVIVLMLWSYYSVQILLFGAELMKARACQSCHCPSLNAPTEIQAA